MYLSNHVSDVGSPNNTRISCDREISLYTNENATMTKRSVRTNIDSSRVSKRSNRCKISDNLLINNENTTPMKVLKGEIIMTSSRKTKNLDNIDNLHMKETERATNSHIDHYQSTILQNSASVTERTYANQTSEFSNTECFPNSKGNFECEGDRNIRNLCEKKKYVSRVHTYSMDTDRVTNAANSNTNENISAYRHINKSAIKYHYNREKEKELLKKKSRKDLSNSFDSTKYFENLKNNTLLTLKEINGKNWNDFKKRIISPKPSNETERL